MNQFTRMLFGRRARSMSNATLEVRMTLLCSMRRARRRSPRRGVLLLMVLSLLVLFVLIGVTFVIVASQYTRSAKASARHERQGDDPVKEMDGAMLRVLRGSIDADSVTGHHSLLRDLYGVDGFQGVIAAAVPAEPSLQTLRINFLDHSSVAYTQADPVALQNGNRRDYFAGGLLTMVDGEGARHSTRILRYMPPSTVGAPDGNLVVLAFADLPTGFVPQPGQRFIVNGPAFNGTGEGYNTASGELNAKVPMLPPTLLNPSLVATYNGFELALLPFAPLDAFRLGDTDESWDAADYQNVHLARIPNEYPPTRVPSSDNPLLPSFHRPDLVNYWMHRLATSTPKWDTSAFNPLRRWITARPLPQDHPYFSGSNPAFAATVTGFVPDPVGAGSAPIPKFDLESDLDQDGVLNAYDSDSNGDGSLDDLDADGWLDTAIVRGPWDVDNDNDGVADSVWVDLGDRVKMMPDGRLYKPLYAILCVDMDGRLNLNAHGQRNHVAIPSTPMLDADGGITGAVGTPLQNVVLGQGVGPAEIRLDLALAMTAPFTPLTQPLALLLQDRYQSVQEVPPTPGVPNWPGESPDSFLQQWGTPVSHYGQLAELGSAYQTPADGLGVGGIYLDANGQPRYHWHQQPGYVATGSLGAESVDDPYENNLVSPQGGDSIYSIEDLEQLVRVGDLDTRTFGGRLRHPASGLLNQTSLLNPLQLRRFTTHSFDIPAVGSMVPEDDDRQALFYQAGNRFPTTNLVGYLRTRLIAGGFGGSLAPADRELALNQQVELMLAREVRQGQKMDLNRPFGNLKDDNANGVVDEPVESLAPQRMWNHPAYAPYSAMFQSDGAFGRDDPHYPPIAPADNPTNGYFSRQIFARQLYCLAMLVMEPNFRVPTSATGANDKRELTSRRIAQWAINVVDFRDADAIMTPFEYDVNPFDANGWSVDDDFRTNDNGTGTPPNTDRRIVWGLERPELLITESLAFHDRRVRDLEKDSRDAGKRYPDENQDGDPIATPPKTVVDDNLDQYRIPQGSLFLELYATGTTATHNPVVNPEISSANADPQLTGVDLGRLTPGNSFPVWRVVFSTPPANVTNPTSWTAHEMGLLGPALLPLVTSPPNGQASVPMDPNDAGLLGTYLQTTGVPELSGDDRALVFATGAFSVPVGPTQLRRENYFYRRGGAPPILPAGRYAVVGPRPVTVLGSKRAPRADGFSDPSIQRLVLDPTAVGPLGFRQFDQTGAVVVNDIQPFLAMVAAANVPPTWTSSPVWVNNPIGLNVSEPAPMPRRGTYYAEPDLNTPNLPPGEVPSYYDDPRTPAAVVTERFPDDPFDGEDDRPLATDPAGGDPERSQYLMTGTHRMFRMALLQRLADPTRDWHAVTNPYITVDTQTIDLTVFNGEEDSEDAPAGWDNRDDNPEGDGGNTPYDPSDDPNNSRTPNPDEQFGARERGRLAGAGAINLWDPISSEAPKTTRVVADDFFGHRPRQTLGYLNLSYGPRRTTAMPPAQYVGSPLRPFPWVAWHNRPFANHLDLLVVPSSAPWRLPAEVRRPPSGSDSPFDDFHAPLVYLLNFFYNDPPAGEEPALLSRLLELVEVPSPFVGTQQWLNPKANPAAQFPPDLKWLHPPFNKVSQFRDPGKVNLNTIVDETVWRAVWGDPGYIVPWDRVQQSLAGDKPISERPAFVSNPLRGPSAADLMPLSDLKGNPTDCTLLRQDPVNNDVLLFDNPSANPYNDSAANPYFRYQRVMRLGNLVTSHSNVYAVWVTVGYFEVHPWNPADPANFNLPPFPDAAHPDGYQLGQEIGSDTGQMKRHRAFYILDRSIPVGFEQGQNHNVEDAVLLRRYLE